MLTKLDKLDDEILIGHPENLFDSGVVDVVFNSFCRSSSIPRQSVLPIINYQGPYETPDYVVQLLSTSIYILKKEVIRMIFDNNRCPKSGHP